MDDQVTSDKSGSQTAGPKGGGSGAATAKQPKAGKTSDADHQPVSSEGGGGAGGESDGAEIAPDSYGQGGSGELERVPGFDESVLESSGLAGGKRVAVTPDLESLPDAGSLAYASAETVCGADERVQVTATAVVPWRWICQLIITYSNGSRARGTGWFIGPHTVMTAGHCVHSAANGGWAREIEVIPGMNAASRPFGSQVGRYLPQRDGVDRQCQPRIRLRRHHPSEQRPG